MFEVTVRGLWMNDTTPGAQRDLTTCQVWLVLPAVSTKNLR